MNSISISNRTYEIGNNITDTLLSSSVNNYFCTLDYLEVIDVIGEKACPFLQGQLTNDIFQIQSGELQKNLLCNIKGQIISLLYVGKHEHYFMICPKDLSADVKAILTKTAALSKVELTINPNMQVFGLVESNTKQLKLSIEPPCSDYIEKPNLFWHYLNLNQSHVQIYPATCRMFLPHQLELEQHGWIHFQKGCYRGQEIIARMHYLGKSKYHLRTITSKCSSNLEPGRAIYDQHQQKIGEIVDFSPISEAECLILVCIKKDFSGTEFIFENPH